MTVFLDKDRMMENIKQHNICTNVPSSQTFRSYLQLERLWCGWEDNRGMDLKINMLYCKFEYVG
jgi:hypothetical protein